MDNGVKKAIDVEDDQFLVNPKDFSGAESQQWELLTQPEIIKDLYNASESNPKDATFLYKGYNIGRKDTDADIWTSSSTLTKASKVSTELGGVSGSYSDNQSLRIYNKKVSSGKNSTEPDENRHQSSQWSLSGKLSDFQRQQ